jgi:hypothetical protein
LFPFRQKYTMIDHTTTIIVCYTFVSMCIYVHTQGFWQHEIHFHITHSDCQLYICILLLSDCELACHISLFLCVYICTCRDADDVSSTSYYTFIHVFYSCVTGELAILNHILVFHMFICTYAVILTIIGESHAYCVTYLSLHMYIYSTRNECNFKSYIHIYSCILRLNHILFVHVFICTYSMLLMAWATLPSTYNYCQLYSSYIYSYLTRVTLD